MKKYVYLIILLLSFPIVANARNDSINVSFGECVDGDTAIFIYKDEKIKARFLAVDTPETKHPTKKEQPYGKEASNYTCDALKNANKIKLEFDKGSDEKDKYDRYLVWVFVDDELLQTKLIEKGYAKVAYIYGKYKYTNILEEKESIAKEEKVGIWSEEQEEESKETEKNSISDYIFLILVIIFIIISIIVAAKKRSK